MAKPPPSVECLRNLLEYDPASGTFVWKEKRPEDVSSGNSKTRQRIARNWNARYRGKPAFVTVSARGYYVGSIELVKCYAHRVAWAMHYGEWPDGEVDHINGDPIDNRIDNLRVVRHADQMKNLGLQARNKTGHMGVWWDARRQKYQAYIRHAGKRVSLGRFSSIEDARRAREDAAERLGFHENHGARPSAKAARA